MGVSIIESKGFSLGLKRCLKGSDLMSWLQTSRDKLQPQKSPQGLRHAGSQDFIG